MIIRSIIFVRFVILIIFLFGCKGYSGGQYKYHPPRQKEDGLDVGTIRAINLDTILIAKAINRIHRGKYGEIHSVLIYKSGKFVLEEYFEGHDYQWDAPKHYGPLVEWEADMIHSVHSVSKSITSLCISIAIDKGFIDNVHQSIFDYLPDYQYLKTDKKYITIEHLLTCTSGLQWAEWSAPLSSMENDQIAIWFHEKGPVDFVLQRHFVAEPGKQFNYSGGGIDLLGVIIENASGMSFEDFSARFLFEPLGIKTAEWSITFPTGEVHAAGGLTISPRDMLKIGVMMLNKGKWNGERIISEEWVEKSKFPYASNKNIKIPGEDLGRVGYSYTWWTKSLNADDLKINWYSAGGWGGQKIIVLPEIETVIVFTGANYTSKVKQFGIIEDYLLPALQ